MELFLADSLLHENVADVSLIGECGELWRRWLRIGAYGLTPTLLDVE